MWFRAWWFYPAAAFKATFFGLPLLLLGCGSIIRRRDVGLVLLVAALITPVVLFSMMQVKQASYIFPAFPGLMVLLALGWLRLRESPGRWEIALAFTASTATALFFFSYGVFGARELMAITGLYVAFLATAFTPVRWMPMPHYAVFATVFGAMLLADVIAVKGTLQHRTYFREIAEFFRSSLEHRDASEVSFIAPEFPSMEFYTFRRGEYWQTFYFQKSDEAFITDLKSGVHTFYVVDHSGKLYGGKPSPAKLAALAAHAKDVTPEIERRIGHPLPVQVLVPVTISAPLAQTLGERP
jgi:hypothetical protein